MNRAEGGRLLARYFDGDLPAEEQRQLFEALASDQELYNAFAEEALLAEMLRDPGFRAKVAAAVQPRVGRSLPFLRGWHARWQLAGAMALILLLVSALYFYRANHRAEGNLAKGGAPPAAERPIPAMLTVVLLPTERSQSGGVHQVVLGDQQTVRLEMDPGAGSYSSYRATLVSLDTTMQRDFDGLKSGPGEGGLNRLAVELPSHMLPSGDYTLTVSGVTTAGAVEPVAGYSFSIMRKR